MPRRCRRRSTIQSRGAELAKSVDGRPPPTMTACMTGCMTAWGDGASTAALVLRQVLTGVNRARYNPRNPVGRPKCARAT